MTIITCERCGVPLSHCHCQENTDNLFPDYEREGQRRVYQTRESPFRRQRRDSVNAQFNTVFSETIRKEAKAMRRYADDY